MFIAIAGNIGSGKSSLTSLLHQKFGWAPHFESVDDNPYLPDFYADMRRWSFHLQVYFLSKRFMLHRGIAQSGKDVVQDRSIYEDAEIFALNLHAMGNMDDRDYENYRALYEAMTSYLKAPDLLVYLRASVPTLQRQIQLRGREFEQTIATEYLVRLNTLYEDWIQRYTLGPTLVIDTDSTDFVHDMQRQEEVLYTIEHAVRRRKV
ncbi:MAG TPA: deoxynucleoside kinase [Bacteroidota bacterium]|nr:deoxynucleoside kinase [Bacteroidota bacterium]